MYFPIDLWFLLLVRNRKRFLFVAVVYWFFRINKRTFCEAKHETSSVFKIGRSADLPPQVLASSGQEWQFHIATVRAHIGRSSGRFIPLVVASSGQEWQFNIATVRTHIGRSTGRSPPHKKIWPVDLNGNFRFLLLQLIWADQLADVAPPQVDLPVDLNGNFKFLLSE